MKIHSFSAKNYGPFKSLEVPIGSMNGVWWVQGINNDKPGNNGVGKSTFYDPLFYALTGQSIESSGRGKEANKTLGDLPTDLDDGVKNSMEVTAHVDDKIIVRGHNPKKFKVYRVRTDGTHEDLTSTISQDALEREWRVNTAALLYMYRFGGGETGLTSYFQGTAEFHRRIQDALIQADRLTRGLEASRMFLNGFKNQRNLLSQEVASLSDSVEAIRVEIASLQAKKLQHDTDHQEQVRLNQGRIDALNLVDLDQEEASRVELDRLSNEATRLDIDIENKMANIKEKDEEIKQLLAIHDEQNRSINEMRDELDSILLTDIASRSRQAHELYEAKKTEYSQYQASISRKDELTKLRQACEDRIRTAQEELRVPRAELEKKLPKQAEDIKPHKERLEQITLELAEAEAYIETIQARINEISDSPSQIDAIKSTIDDKNRLIDEKKREIADLDAEIDSIRNLEPGTTCPTCKGSISEDHIEHAVIYTDNKKVRHLEAIDRLGVEIIGLQDRMTQVLALNTELDEKRKIHTETQATIKKLKAEEKGIRSNIALQESIGKIYESAVATKQAAASLIKSIEGNIKSYQEQKARHEEQLGTLSLPSEEFLTSIEEARVAYEAAAERLNGAQVKRERIGASIEAAKLQIDQRATDITTKKKANRVNKTALIEQQGTLTVLRESIAHIITTNHGKEPMTSEAIGKARENRRNEEATRVRLAQTINPYDQLVAAKEGELSTTETKLKNAQGKLSEVDGDIPYYKFWEVGCGPDGIRPMAMREMTPELNKQMTYWMSRLPGHQVGLKFDHDFDLKFYDWETNLPMRYARLSNGMKMRTNIAIALSFRQNISLSSECHLPIFVSDEGLECLDAEGMAGYYRCLEEIGRDSCVFLINHHPLMEQLAKSNGAGRIVIERSQRTSTLRIE